MSDGLSKAVESMPLDPAETCQCAGYGIAAAVLLGLSLLFLGCNVCIAVRQNARRPPRPLETQLL
jgi:hypothetical protein